MHIFASTSIASLEVDGKEALSRQGDAIVYLVTNWKDELIPQRGFLVNLLITGKAVLRRKGGLLVG